MENTVGLDNTSNSGSDISDSWAVIDDESNLEWNNVIGLGRRPHQNDFIQSNSTLPSRTNSRNELSDEESIEVVAEDHSDDLSDKDIEVVQDEEWTMANHLETKENTCSETITPDLPHYAKPTQQKKENIQWTESNPILITILIMAILVGLCLGYLLASHAQQSQVSTSIQPTRALLIKLQSDNLFLRRRLRSVHSSMKAAISNTMPNLHHLTKQDLHNKTNDTSLNRHNSEMCSITDFMIQAHILDNASKDYCLVSDNLQSNGNILTRSTDIYADNNTLVDIAPVSSSMNISFVKDQMQTGNTRVNIIPNENLALYDSMPINHDSLHGPLNNAEAHCNTEVIESDNSQDVIDPRPYTKHRTIVDKIYTMLSVLDNEKQFDLPFKLELLSILPQNIGIFDLSKHHFTTNSQEEIANFDIQIQDITQKLLNDIDSYIINVVQNIALKIKEVKNVNTKLICDLKTTLENSADIALPDLNRITIFQKCIEDKQYEDLDIVKSENGHEVEGKCFGSEGFVAIESIISDQSKIKSKLSPTKKKDVLENESQIAVSTHPHNQPETGIYLNQNIEMDEYIKEMERGLKTDKKRKTRAKRSYDHIQFSKHERTDKKRIPDTKEKKYNEAQGKTMHFDDFDDHVKISKHEKPGNKRISDNGDSTYDDAHGKTMYNDYYHDLVPIDKREAPAKKRMFDKKERKYNDHVQINKHEESGTKTMSVNKETKHNDYDDHVQISKHEKPGNKRMFYNKDSKYDDAYGQPKHNDYDDHVKFTKHEDSSKKKRKFDSTNKETKYDEAHGKTKYNDYDGHVKTSKHEEAFKKKRTSDYKEEKSSETRGKGQQNRSRSRQWTVHMDKASNVSGEWVIKMAHGRAEQRRQDHQSDWVFDRAESREFSRKKSSHPKDRYYSGKFFNSGVCNKTVTFKDEISKNWKVMKHCMKENIWKPLVNTAKSTKKAFNRFNDKFRYHSRRE